jgi:hypothetical protein
VRERDIFEDPIKNEWQFFFFLRIPLVFLFSSGMATCLGHMLLTYFP